jgi:hypothetical protein
LGKILPKQRKERTIDDDDDVVVVVGALYELTSHIE